MLVAHTFDGIATLDGRETPSSAKVRSRHAGSAQAVNTDSAMRRFTVSGTPFRVLAIDGNDLNGPGLLDTCASRSPREVAIDIGFVMPPGGVRVGLEGTGAALASEPERRERRLRREHADGGLRPSRLRHSRRRRRSLQSSRFDRSFELTITKKLGFFDGRPGRHWALNGGIYPDVPDVRRRATATSSRVTIANDTNVVHPMHLHGHHALVLSRNGQPATGSPWWTDTLDVDAGDEYEIAFRADNPGIWMDHCHNLGHAAPGSRCTSSTRGSRRRSSSEASTANAPE